jgi:tight adherence protein B
MTIYNILISVFAFGAVLALVLGVVPAVSERISKIVAQQELQHEAALHSLFIGDVTPREVTYLAIFTAVVVAVILELFIGSHVFAIVGALVVLTLPPMVFANLKRARLTKFEEQLPAALDQIASGAKAGLSLKQAIEETASTSPSPTSDEFSLLVQDTTLGSELGAAIDNTRKRLNSKQFGLVATALNVNRQKGGNLPEALDRMSASLKEIWRLEQKLITASAEGRKAMLVISVIPVFVFVMVMLMQPDLAAKLTESLMGFVILAIAVILYVAGIMWLLRILRVAI